MKRFIVDRLEGDKAVLECENGDMVVLDRASLPKSIKEGDVLRFESESCYLNAEETECRRQKMCRMIESVFDTNT